MIVVDASVTVDMLLGTGSEAGDALAASLGSGETVCAPHLMDAEDVPGCAATVEVVATSA